MALGVIAAACAACGESTPAASGGSATPLTAVEITEYEGEKLSSISELQDVSIAGPQTVDIDTYRLTIDGLVETPAELTYDEVLAYPHYTKNVVLNCVEGWSADLLWEGIQLKDLFDTVTVKPEATTVIFYAVDGYSTALPLQTVLDKNLMIAYMVNGVDLPDKDGYPFILVAEDKLGYKWIKWLDHIELSDDAGYQGYWESRGYSNDASVAN